MHPPSPSIYIPLLGLQQCGKQSFPQFTNSVPASILLKYIPWRGTTLLLFDQNHGHQFNMAPQSVFNLYRTSLYTETEISKANRVLYDHPSEKDCRYWTLKHGTECTECCLIGHFTVALFSEQQLNDVYQE